MMQTQRIEGAPPRGWVHLFGRREGLAVRRGLEPEAVDGRGRARKVGLDAVKERLLLKVKESLLLQVKERLLLQRGKARLVVRRALVGLFVAPEGVLREGGRVRSAQQWKSRRALHASTHRTLTARDRPPFPNTAVTTGAPPLSRRLALRGRAGGGGATCSSAARAGSSSPSSSST